MTGLLKSPCIAHQPDGIHPVQIRLIGNRDLPDHRGVRNRGEVYMNLLSGAEIHCPLKDLIIEVFLKIIYENFVGTLETVRNREVSVQRSSTRGLTGRCL